MGAPSSSSSAFSGYQEWGVEGKRSGSCLRMRAAASVAARTVSVMLLLERLCHLQMYGRVKQGLSLHKQGHGFLHMLCDYSAAGCHSIEALQESTLLHD